MSRLPPRLGTQGRLPLAGKSAVCGAFGGGITRRRPPPRLPVPRWVDAFAEGLAASGCGSPD
jgi:hypothetical protein